jgi:tetratricopeptide (TPR) repeat protein
VRLRWATGLHLLDPQSAVVVAEPLKNDNKAGRAPTVAMGKDGSVEGIGRVDRGVTALLRALANPGMSGLELFDLAKTLLAVGLPAESLVEARNASIKDPLMVEPWVLRAQIYAKAGLDTQAVESLDKALEVMGAATGRQSAYTRDEILAGKAAALARLGSFDEALALYRGLADSSPYWFAMGLVEERRGHFEAAQTLFEKVAASGTDPAEIAAAKAKLKQNSSPARP